MYSRHKKCFFGVCLEIHISLFNFQLCFFVAPRMLVQSYSYFFLIRVQRNFWTVDGHTWRYRYQRKQSWKLHRVVFHGQPPKSTSCAFRIQKTQYAILYNIYVCIYIRAEILGCKNQVVQQHLQVVPKHGNWKHVTKYPGQPAQLAICGYCMFFANNKLFLNRNQASES